MEDLGPPNHYQIIGKKLGSTRENDSNIYENRLKLEMVPYFQTNPYVYDDSTARIQAANMGSEWKIHAKICKQMIFGVVQKWEGHTPKLP